MFIYLCLWRSDSALYFLEDSIKKNVFNAFLIYIASYSIHGDELKIIAKKIPKDSEAYKNAIRMHKFFLQFLFGRVSRNLVKCRTFWYLTWAINGFFMQHKFDKIWMSLKVGIHDAFGYLTMIQIKFTKLIIFVTINESQNYNGCSKFKFVKFKN